MKPEDVTDEMVEAFCAALSDSYPFDPRETIAAAIDAAGAVVLSEDTAFAVDACQHHLLAEIHPQRKVHHISGRNYTVAEIRDLLRELTTNA